jgi:hypothetical protein
MAQESPLVKFLIFIIEEKNIRRGKNQEGLFGRLGGNAEAQPGGAGFDFLLHARTRLGQFVIRGKEAEWSGTHTAGRCFPNRRKRCFRS